MPLIDLVKDHWASAATAAAVSVVTLASAILTGATRPHAYTSLMAERDFIKQREWTRQYISKEVPPPVVRHHLQVIDKNLAAIHQAIGRIENQMDDFQVELVTMRNHSHEHKHK